MKHHLRQSKKPPVKKAIPFDPSAHGYRLFEASMPKPPIDYSLTFPPGNYEMNNCTVVLLPPGELLEIVKQLGESLRAPRKRR